MGSFIYLGASDYALRVLREILTRFDSRLLCIIDSDVTDARRTQIARNLPVNFAANNVHDVSVLTDVEFLSTLRTAAPSVALSVHFSQILDDSFLGIPINGVVNLHSGYLPFNRGHWPEVWSIVHGTPAGITLHYIDSGIDSGPIIDQAQVKVLSEDTCGSLAAKIEDVGIGLVTNNWQSIVCGRTISRSQETRYPLNLHKHLELISEIDLDKMYRGRELINLLRALTIAQLLKGAFFVDRETGDRIHIRVSLEREAASSLSRAEPKEMTL